MKIQRPKDKVKSPCFYASFDKEWDTMERKVRQRWARYSDWSKACSFRFLFVYLCLQRRMLLSLDIETSPLTSRLYYLLQESIRKFFLTFMTCCMERSESPPCPCNFSNSFNLKFPYAKVPYFRRTRSELYHREHLSKGNKMILLLKIHWQLMVMVVFNELPLDLLSLLRWFLTY